MCAQFGHTLIELLGKYLRLNAQRSVMASDNFSRSEKKKKLKKIFMDFFEFDTHHRRIPSTYGNRVSKNSKKQFSHQSDKKRNRLNGILHARHTHTENAYHSKSVPLIAHVTTRKI